MLGAGGVGGALGGGWRVRVARGLRLRAAGVIAGAEEADGDEDDDHGLEGLAVVHGAVREVVRERKDEDGEQVGHGGGRALVPEAAEAAEESPYEKEAEGEVGDVEGFVFEVAGAEGPVTGPEANDAVNRGTDELNVVVGEEGDCQLVLLRDVGRFPKGLVGLHLRGVRGRMGPGRVRLGFVAVVAGVELDPEAVADKEAIVERVVIAQVPRGADGEEGDGGEDALALPGSVDAPDLVHGDEEQQGQHGEDGRIAKHGDGVERAEAGPGEVAAEVQLLGDEEAGGEEQGGKGVVPDAVGGEVDGEGVDGPGDDGDAGDAGVERVADEKEERDAGERGAQAVEAEDGGGGGGRVEAEEAEHSREDVRVDGGDQGSGSGDGEEGRGEALAEEDAAGGPAHLPSEGVVIEGDGGDFGDDKGDDDHPENEGEADDGGEEDGKIFEGGREGLEDWSARAGRHLSGLTCE